MGQALQVFNLLGKRQFWGLTFPHQVTLLQSGSLDGKGVGCNWHSLLAYHVVHGSFDPGCGPLARDLVASWFPPGLRGEMLERDHGFQALSLA